MDSLVDHFVGLPDWLITTGIALVLAVIYYLWRQSHGLGTVQVATMGERDKLIELYEKRIAQLEADSARKEDRIRWLEAENTQLQRRIQRLEEQDDGGSAG